ncbi:MAG TPA: T9SS type A sorting domain-containing protein [Ignavibacteriaceae bacterium]|nr:T9SS type A sorting domain-containing protein [Ignavibacteriaceae bacterium]
MRKLIAVTFTFFTIITYGQVSIDWVQFTRGVSIATDNTNNVYTVDYDYNPAGDITLTKRDTDGNFLWSEKYDQTDNSKWEKATWVAVDNLGNVYVSGTLMSGYSNPVNAASILMKFDTNGNLVWRNVYENSFDGSYTKKCLIDSDNNIYVLGMGSGPAGFVTKVKKFTPEGLALWTYYDADGIGAPINFKFTPDNGLVITGRAIFGSVNGYAKIDLDGNKIWSFPGVNSLTIGDSDGDEFGNTYLVHGEFITNGGTTVKKISPTGSLIWSNNYSLAGFRVEVGTDNLPVVCGFPNQNSVGSSFIKIDGNGNTVWFNPDADGTYALLLHAQLMMDQYNNIYLAAGTLFEMAVCKVNSDGTSAYTITTSGSYANAFTLGSDYSVYVVGGTTAKINQTIPISTVMHVGAQTVTRELSGRAKYRGVDQVLVLDENNQPVAGATVRANYTGPTNGRTSAVTGADGIATLYSKFMRNPVGTWCFEVISLTKSGFTYDPNGNVITTQCESAEILTKEFFELTEYTLEAYPNPFNPTTTISFSIPETGYTSLKVYDILGNEVANLVNEVKDAGIYNVQFDGSNLTSGVYIYQLQTGEYTATKKIQMIK